MASGGKKKTTMAKLARENKLRERRADKQARKDARRQAAALGETFPLAAAEPAAGDDRSDEVVDTFVDDGVEPIDPRAKEVALTRLRESPEEELAVFGGTLRDDALEAGASEQEMRQAQRDHPGHAS